ncbi:MAG: glycosyltransferase family 2 protein [Deltaproteobacteria bacterium]|nr:glycosyltransferase family 2 protein [Deltaproteobacteria bacterium]
MTTVGRLDPVRESAVLFLIFNRPDTTRRVFGEIRRARPARLYIAADGPRTHVPGEGDRCAATRSILGEVDWPCDVHTLLLDTNLGCRRAVSSAITWFFEQEEEGIILEDDCLPHPTFFHYCRDLLERYRDDTRIAMVSGDNFQFGRRRTEYSHYFSRYPHIWGWASWRRTWSRYDVDLKGWPEVRDGDWLRDYFGRRSVADFWRRTFEDTYRGKVDTWDHQLTFSCVTNSWLCVVPSVNLVSNIGFGSLATRTQGRSRLAELPTEAMKLPLTAPPFVIRDDQADRVTEDEQFRLGLAGRASGFLGRIRGQA